MFSLSPNESLLKCRRVCSFMEFCGHAGTTAGCWQIQNRSWQPATQPSCKIHASHSMMVDRRPRSEHGVKRFCELDATLALLTISSVCWLWRQREGVSSVPSHNKATPCEVESRLFVERIYSQLWTMYKGHGGKRFLLILHTLKGMLSEISAISQKLA